MRQGIRVRTEIKTQRREDTKKSKTQNKFLRGSGSGSVSRAMNFDTSGPSSNPVIGKIYI